jgi:hypothetical protein
MPVLLPRGATVTAKRQQPTAYYWRIRIHETNEEQIFNNYLDGLQWAQKVANTLMVTVHFDAVEVSERTGLYVAPYPEEVTP